MEYQNKYPATIKIIKKYYIQNDIFKFKNLEELNSFKKVKFKNHKYILSCITIKETEL